MNTFNRILFVANGAAAESYALARAGALAEASGADLLTIMNVGGSTAPQRTRPDGADSSGERGYLVSSSQVLPLHGGSRLRIETDCTIDDVIDAAQTHDLVVMPARDKGGARRSRASTENRLLMRYCDCPVLVIKRQEQDPPARILAAVNLELTIEESVLARSVLDAAAALASFDNASLEVVESWQIRRVLELRERANVARLMSEMEAAHRTQIEQLVAECGYPAEIVHVAYGEPRDTIPALAKRREIDLVVVAAERPTAIARMLAGASAERLLTATGTEKLLNRLDCSLLTVNTEAAREGSESRRTRRSSLGHGRPRMANSAHA